MPDAWNSIKVQEFEHVLAGPTVALLRVSGKPSRRRSTTGPRPVLLADDGQVIRRFAAIPAPPDARGVLRAAWSVSADLVTTSTSFSLELADETVIALPPPQPGAARLIPESGNDSESEPAEEPEPPDGADERRSGLVSQLAELSARVADSEQARDELEQSVAALTKVNEGLEHELVGARERAARSGAEAEKSGRALEELETWRAELERRLTETTDELSAAKMTGTSDQAELLRLGGELAEAKAKVELLQAQVTALGDQLAHVDERPAPVPYSTSEREAIANQAGQLATLLEGAERLSELASELAGARAQAEILHATASAEPAPQGASPATGDPPAAGRAEIEDLRAQLAQARDAATEAQIEAVGHAAEAEARELAELELARVAAADY